jgi:hypothetical protein
MSFARERIQSVAKWILVCLLVLVGCQVAPTEEGGQWLTTPLQRDGDEVVFIGPDLSNQVGQSKVYTYYSRGVWVALLWEGYQDDRNVWRLTDELKRERPDWETNQAWSLDFWWPDSWGALPARAVPGTSSR